MGLFKTWLQKHPLMTMWIALAIGMVVILLVVPKEAVLLPGQMAVLIVSTIVLAGLCVWIISWE